MNIVYSWKEGLTLLLPRNLKPFALVTLKSIAECYKIYLKYFWWIPVIALIRSLAYIYWWSSIGHEVFYGKNYFIMISRSAFEYTRYALFDFNTIVVWLAMRPSIDAKNWAYFKSMLCKYFPAFIVLFLINMQLRMLLDLIIMLFYMNPFAIFAWPIFYIWHLVTLFFVTDVQNSIKNFFESCWRALLMLMYNLPILLITFALLVIAFIPVSMEMDSEIATVIPVWCIRPLNILLSPIAICTFANIYIKRVREQYDLYFTQKEAQGNI